MLFDTVYCTWMHHAQCRNHGVLNLPYLWFNLANRFPAHFKSYCYAEEAHFIIQREWSRTIVSIEGCWVLAAVKYATTTMYKCRQRCSEAMPMVTVKSSSISAGTSHLKLSRSLKDQYWMTARTPGLMASLLLNANDMLLRLRPLLPFMLWSLVVHNLHRHA